MGTDDKSVGDNSPGRPVLPVVYSVMGTLLVVFSWWVTWSTFTPPHFDAPIPLVVWVAAALGSASLLGCAFFCFSSSFPVGKRRPLLIAGPVLCLICAGIAALKSQAELEAAVGLADHEQRIRESFFTVTCGIWSQAICYLWAAGAFFGAVLVAAKLRAAERGAPRDKLSWIWLAIGILVAVDVLIIRFPARNVWGVGFAATAPESRYMMTEYLPIYFPQVLQIVSVLLLAAVAIGLLSASLFPFGLRPRKPSAVEAEQDSSALGLAAVGIAAGMVAVALAIRSKLSGDLLWALAAGVPVSEPSAQFRAFQEAAWGSSWIGRFHPGFLALGGLVVAVLVVWRVRKRLSTWLPAFGFAVAGLTFAVGSNALSGQSRVAALNLVNYECLVTLLMHHLGGGDPELKPAYLKNRARLMQPIEVDVPRVSKGQRLEDMTVLEISDRSISVDMVKVADLRFGKVDESMIGQRETIGHYIRPLFDSLREKAVHRNMIASRIGGVFDGKLAIAISSKTSISLAQLVRRTAIGAGYSDHYFVVRPPRKTGQLCEPLGLIRAPPVDQVPNGLNPESPYVELMKNWKL